MRREGAKKHADVIKAFIDGADVQFLDSEGHWRDDSHPSFIEGVEYRVKPKPLEHWVVVDQEGQIISCRFTSYKHAMDYTVECGIKNYRIVHFREVV